MIIDAHCHAWENWPYEPAVPDPSSRGRVERLLWEMDQHGVSQAILISASIKDNPENKLYTYACAKRFPDRVIAFPDVDCRWSPAHHTPGAAERLTRVADRLKPLGFTHYLNEEADPSWLISPDGLAFFGVAEKRGLIASIACGPTQAPTIRALAERFPAMPILIHHLGRIAAQPLDKEALRDVLAAADAPNVYVKMSGFGYAVSDGWNFPCAPTRDIARALFDRYGADRLCWASDYPVSQRFATYRQTIEIVRMHLSEASGAEMSTIFGGTIKRLLDAAGVAR